MGERAGKVLVIGSGPIVIGQAAEFDYAGSQACQSLREEGVTVVLCNPNPATIMTDTHMADRVYLEPLTVASATAIIEKERPWGILPTLGGQVGLNLAVQLHQAGVLEHYGVSLLGTPLAAIEQAEDREKFKRAMQALGDPVPASGIASSVEDAVAVAESIGFPVVVRPAYTLGGTGGGMARTRDQLKTVAEAGLKASPIGQVLVERGLQGWKEIEYEVMRDARDNCITVCSMENLDPMGIHTGDSTVVAPTQTLSDREYQMLRGAALRIIRHLGIEGGCNVQFALDPHTSRYFVIEVNPRVSRSSALASKATGYPIARVAAKLALGISLDEIPNPITGNTRACFEPALDYVVVKVPRWPFDKFPTAYRRLGTEMKSTGEVMAIGRTFLEALGKAVRSLEIGWAGLLSGAQTLGLLSREHLEEALAVPDDRRLLLLVQAFRQGLTVEEVADLTGIDLWFLRALARLVREADRLAAGPAGDADWRRLKSLGLSDADLSLVAGCSEGEDGVRQRRVAASVRPVYKMVDTCAGEFEAATPYFYSTYSAGEEDEASALAGRRVMVLGSGPIRIGQGIEFDYCTVHAVWALREMGYRAIIVNNNPETVSTDYSTADRLYFEPLTREDVLAVCEREQPEGVIVQFGGQTAINLAAALARGGVRILGTSPEAIDRAEDRRQFDQLLAAIGIPRPLGGTATSAREARAIADRLGYPVLVRPSYVLGGRAMEVVYSPAEMARYIEEATRIAPGSPVLVDRYLPGKEVEVDAVADGEEVLVAGIMEHLERAGIHSGDSVAVYPPQTLSPAEIDTVASYTTLLARALGICGMLNVQYVIYGGQVWVLEANPRASRTVPFLTKATGLPLVRLATRAMMGLSLREQGYGGGRHAGDPARGVAVKVPVFSWSKLLGVDAVLGPEMKSTGEVMGLGSDLASALEKAFLAAGLYVAGAAVPVRGIPGDKGSGTAGARGILLTVADQDKPEILGMARSLAGAGFGLYATRGTARFLSAAGLQVAPWNKVSEGSPHVLDLLRRGEVQVVVNTVSGREDSVLRDGYLIRRTAAELGIPCLTALDTARALIDVL
ncbi:MAG TPA: carbamoyl-phosphate synthase large subunit, partial [Firmicutes bacterium]|nr:carbamoyl-phosphate synthase large subunit [Bacillota bacterium]